MGVQVASIQNNDLSQQTRIVRSKAVLLICRFLTIGLALLEAWSQRHFLNEDGVAYLDMSDAFLKHNWHLLVNPIWSPLYPVLIGAATWILHPSASYEIVLVHAINLLVLLAALASFEFLLHEVIKVCTERAESLAETARKHVPVWALQLLGYSFFIWSTFGMIWAPRMVTPDLCVATFVYLDCALLLKLRSGRNELSTCIWLGVALGIGYVAKAILFPIAFVAIIISFLLIRDRKRALLPVASMCVAFGVVSAPLVVAMSARVGKLSYSEAGTLNYAWHVDRIFGGKPLGGPFFYPSEVGAPPFLQHPMTLLFKHPDAYSFREPQILTYPPRSDMGYWGTGTKAPFNLQKQTRATTEGIATLLTDSHILPLSALIVAGLWISLAIQGRSRTFDGMQATWPLVIVGVVGTALYLLISVEPRYVAPFFAVILLGLLPGLLPLGLKYGERKAANCFALVAACLIVPAAGLVAYHLAGFPRGESGELFLTVGQLLNKNGVQPGEDVAIVGDSSDGCRWARMGRVHVVAQILRQDVNEFWQVSPETRSQVLAVFQRAGANAVVAEDTPPSDLAEWHRLGDTHYYVHFFGSPATK